MDTWVAPTLEKIDEVDLGFSEPFMAMTWAKLAELVIGSLINHVANYAHFWWQR
jgi:hypothetical protein